MLAEAYERLATLDRVIDGDTFSLRVDLGFDVWAVQTVRLLGCDAWDTEDGADKKRLATSFAEVWFAMNPKVLIRTHPVTKGVNLGRTKKERYGRYLAEVVGADGLLAEALIVNGHARRWT